jgi:hypothetical protein
MHTHAAATEAARGQYKRAYALAQTVHDLDTRNAMERKGNLEPNDHKKGTEACGSGHDEQKCEKDRHRDK